MGGRCDNNDNLARTRRCCLFTKQATRWHDPEALAQLPETLTAREREVVELHAKGMSQRAIALALGISRSAVRARLENAGRKLAAEQAEPS